MASHVAFLRGINLGKRRRVRSEVLVGALESIGLAEVSAFRASGNLAFEAAGGERLAAPVEAALLEALGFEVSVFLRSARQVRQIASQRPFDPGSVGASQGKLQVALLSARPSAAARRRALGLAGAADSLAIRGGELYWLPAAALTESQLDLRALEATLGPWTMRTMGTIEQIAARHCA